MEIINEQTDIKINSSEYLEFTENAVLNFPPANGKTLTIAFFSDEQIGKLNKQFRGRNNTTDVLSFPFEADEFEVDENYLGDIAISAPQAAKQAAENELELELEIKQLILHGILHLCGYDHETDNGEMNELELQLRDKLGVN